MGARPVPTAPNASQHASVPSNRAQKGGPGRDPSHSSQAAGNQAQGCSERHPPGRFFKLINEPDDPADVSGDLRGTSDDSGAAR